MAMAVFSERIWNFNAGPAMLPREVMEEAQASFLNYQSSGMSVLEISHREKHFQAILDKALADFRELLEIPDRFGVVFFPGGATLQFSCVPLNYLRDGDSADFALTGVWATKAYEEAKKFFPNVKSIYEGKENHFREIPKITDDSLHPDAKYLHITSNNTIFGTRYSELPVLQKVPLVVDMTSDILSRTFSWDSIGVVFAGAQKNIGPSGLCVVAYDKTKLPSSIRPLPNLMNYQLMEKNNSVYNTPPTFSIYLAGLVFQWLKKKGGVRAIQKQNEEKAALLYNFLDQSTLFYAPVPKEFRSIMNVVFLSKRPEIDSVFLKEAEENGLSGLKGYRDVGGFRASIYNPMPKEGVEALVSFLKHFESKA